MSLYLSSLSLLPTPDPSTLPPPLRALQAAATRQEPGGGGSSNLRPVRKRLTHLAATSTTQPNPLICPVPDDQTCPQNETLFQGFEWYVPADGRHWRRLAGIVPSLAKLGVTKMWIPPGCKAADGQGGNGYDVYDLWDLGEFARDGGDLKGGGGGGDRRTKWGVKEELVALGEVAEKHGVRLLWDAVLNHKTGADFVERVVACKMEERDRMREKEGEGARREIEAWTGFRFPGRRGRYSAMQWRAEHFKGVDWDEKGKERGVWRFVGKEWAKDIDEELGNYDFLMFADIDHSHPEVRADLFRWVEWLPRQVKLGGMRLDAIKHYSFEFLRDFVSHVDAAVDPDWFLVGEYWREDSEFLAAFIEFMKHRIWLFDVQLLGNFSKLSLLEEKGDLRKVLDDSLVLWKPDNAVTFVVNHDTQPGQALETPVLPFFLPLAYALILLRANTGLPCVFYSDLFGSMGPQPHHHHPPNNPNHLHVSTRPPCGGLIIPKLLLARKLWAYGSQHDYFDGDDSDKNCVGFTRLGHPSRSGGAGLAVVMTNAWQYAVKTMFVGKQHAGECWTDVLNWCPGHVVIGEDGFAVFPVGPRSVAVWVSAEALGRGEVDEFVL